jgi:uncharacterized protein (TIGR02588 family)
MSAEKEQDPQQPASGSEATSVENQPVSTIEKVATTVSVLLIAGLLSVLIADAVRPNTDPAFVTRPGKLAVMPGSYRVPITVQNTGDESAKSVVLHMELMALDSILAQSDVIIDWLPGKSSRQAVGLFGRNAKDGQPTEVRAEVRGYATP